LADYLAHHPSASIKHGRITPSHPPAATCQSPSAYRKKGAPLCLERRPGLQFSKSGSFSFELGFRAAARAGWLSPVGPRDPPRPLFPRTPGSISQISTIPFELLLPIRPVVTTRKRDPIGPRASPDLRLLLGYALPLSRIRQRLLILYEYRIRNRSAADETDHTGGTSAQTCTPPRLVSSYKR